MQVIPVIDIQGGVVVRAIGGRRAEYRPIETALADGCKPVAVAAGLLAASGSRAIYVADLDGIAGAGRNLETVAALAAAFPDVALWVDDGSTSATALLPLLAHARIVPVVGSETLTGPAALADIADLTGPRHGWILSLDFKGQDFLGPPGLANDPASWPRRIIVMTLAVVGADAGPDLARVAEITALAGPGRDVFAAGGVRDHTDLQELQRVGAAGVLVASALHSGKIKAGDLLRDRRP